MSIFNLKEGDIITITIATGKLKFSNTVNVTYDNSGTPTTPEAWSYVESDLAYTVKADGKLDLQAMKFGNGGDAHMAISKIVIETSDDEAIETAPLIEVTGANGGARQITITSYNTTLDNTTDVFYTLDGTEPTSSSTAYTGVFNVSSSDDTDSDGYVTVKAISYKHESTTIASAVTTLNVAVGTTLQLNAPIIDMSFALNGSVYNPVYSFSSDQSDIIGAPTLTYTYTFAGGASTSGTSFTPTETGTLRVTVSASGYASNFTDIDVDCVSFLKTYNFNPLTAISVNDGASTIYSNTIHGTGANVYSLNDCTYDLGTTKISLSGFSFAWKISAKTAYGLVVRYTDPGVVSYTLNSGEYITFGKYTGTQTTVVASSETSSTSFSQWNIINDISIYTPASVSGTLPSSGYGSLASAYGLDFSSATGLTAAYVVTNITKDAVTLTSVNELPANSGVILKGAAGATYSIPVKADAAYAGTNKLYAAVEAYDCAANEVYILKDALFHLVTAASTVPAGKAYLKATDVPKEARSLGFLFGDDGTNGINAVSSNQKGSEFYNLQGLRVDAPKKGMYIVNGKKVIIK